DFQSALKTSKEYAELLGRDHFFLEIQDHGTSEDKKINAGMLKLSAETALGMVATNSVHYIRKEQADAHAVLLCMQSQTVMSDPKRLAYQSREYYFKSVREMEMLFDWAPDAVARTAEIAARCDVQLRPGVMHFPAFPVPVNHTAGSYLQALCFDGLKKRYGITVPGNAINAGEKQIVDRAHHELDIIFRTGFANYFLVVWDFVQFARRSNIPVGLRGPGGGSLVAYTIGITDIDPIPYSMVFEIFLNPERASPPDFGIDFCHERRVEVIQYLQRTYSDCSAHIASFGTFSGRMAVRDTARVLEVPHNRLEKILQMLPGDPGITLKNAMARRSSLRRECDLDPVCEKLVAISAVLEGLCRNVGTHASGLVLGEKSLSELVPLGRDKEGQLVTQYSMEHLGGIGLLKMDLLGLRVLTVINDTLALINAGGKSVTDLNAIPLDDPATINLLNCGNTIGVFQLESNGMRELLKRTGPERMDDLIALPALLRPGTEQTLEEFTARKTGRTPRVIDHALLHHVLDETYGLIIYQEQIVHAVCILAGYPPVHADFLRRAISGRDPEAMEAQRGQFVKGCARKHRIPRDRADDLFDKLARAAEYASSKAHNVACAILSYRTAYLKANHPAAYMASLLSNEIGESGKLQIYINEADAMGLRILPPHINESNARFTPVENGVRFGLCGIKNIGSAAVEAVLAEREASGPYSGLTDFCIRMNSHVVHRRVIENLLRSGCFDFPGFHRARLFNGLDSAMSCAKPARHDRLTGQTNFLDAGARNTSGRTVARDEDVIPDCEPWHESRLLAEEKEYLGYYISGHPLSEYIHIMDRYHLSNVKTLIELAEGSKAITGGIVSGIELKTTHQGAEMAVLRMDCPDGEIEIILFPSVYSRYAALIVKGAMIFACGEIRHEEPDHVLRLHAVELCPLSEVHKRLAERVSIHIAATRPADIELAKVRDILHRHPGPIPVVICLEYPGGEKVFLDTDKGFNVMPDDSLIRELEQTVGERSIYVALREHAASVE
ncbi:MAG: DNA polymerase III subunit alpha, partial [bacterium]